MLSENEKLAKIIREDPQFLRLFQRRAEILDRIQNGSQDDPTLISDVLLGISAIMAKRLHMPPSPTVPAATAPGGPPQAVPDGPPEAGEGVSRGTTAKGEC